MTDLNPTPALTPVPQLETNTLALAGTGNPMNMQAQALLNRDAFRAMQIAAIQVKNSNFEDKTDPMLGAAGIGRSIRWIASLDELRALVGQYDGEVIYLRGRTAGSLLGCGFMVWFSGSSLSDNDGTIFGSGSGRWIRPDTNNEVQAEWFGVGNNSTATANDYTTQLQNAIDFAGEAAGGSQGMKVILPRGTIGISNTIYGPNRVAIHGANGRGTIIRAMDTFSPSATEMFNFTNGTTSMFGSRLVDVWLRMYGKGAATARCIYTEAWQETCGAERVCMTGFNKYAIEYSFGYGGAANLPLKDLEIFGGADGTTPSAGIRINQVSLVGAFMVTIDGLGCTGSTGNPMPIGVDMVNDSLTVRAMHVEYMQAAIVMRGIGVLKCDGLTGSANEVTNLITLASTFTGSIEVASTLPNGATETFRNNVRGPGIIPGSAGSQALITYPDKGQSAPLGYVSFTGSGISVGANCTINEKSSNIASVTKNAVGDYTIVYSYNQPTTKRSLAGMMSTDAAMSSISHVSGTISQDRIKTYRLSAGTATLVDESEVVVNICGPRI